ncbi:MAG TPA: phosphoribosylamine--glycine ligase [Candidatus Deferrimicrobium sp.]|nr:phosphoribosylamine--glycine ligase [Candidatus Deferrimicrobium sp.]
MKVLVVGSGGREHALVWKLKKSRKVSQIFCAPGNDGIGQDARCVGIKADNIKGLADFAAREGVALTIVGPEVPLSLGIADEFHRRRLKIFAPGRKAAQLESSKVFAKEFMRKYHIPTAPFRVFSVPAEAIGFCRAVEYPVVIKADGLAAGKGVAVAHNFKEATRAIEDFMVRKVFGQAGDRVVVESFLAGQEVSVMSLTDGKAIRPFLPSQDHKQAYDGDKGPNTGGMGAYCPTSFTPRPVMEEIMEHILLPTVAGLVKEKITYKGVLYAGLMITPFGPKVLEFNCRFGDPETQAVLPLLRSDLLELMQAVVTGNLSAVGNLHWHHDSAACVVMASKGYPARCRTGAGISGLQAAADGCLIFHSGTALRGGRWITAGGRVLGVTGIDKDLKSALKRAYQAVSKIRFEGAMYRRDIGFRAEKRVTS